MTKREFILQAMLQLAGTGRYDDSYKKNHFTTKEKQILNDAVKLAETAEQHLWTGDASNPTSVFEQ